jgi:hypothetical protein
VSGAPPAGTPIVGDAGRERARELTALASTHFEYRDAFGDQDVRRERRELIYLASLEGSGIDPVDHPMSCANDSDLHVDSRMSYARRMPEGQDEF